MKKSLFALAAMWLASSAFAGSTNPYAPEPVAVVPPSPYTFLFGPSVHHERYQEYDLADSKIMQEEAYLVGLKAGISREFSAIGGKLVLTAEYARGNANYTGSYMDGTYGDLTESGLSRLYAEAVGLYKQTAPVWNGLSVAAGLGYRHLVDNMQDAGAAGYKRTNDRLYLILGLEQAISLKSWTITPALQYKHLLSSKQRSELRGGITNTQKNGYGAEASISFAHSRPGLTVSVTPYYKLWDVKDSEVDETGLYEPRNKTTELGASVDFLF